MRLRAAEKNLPFEIEMADDLPRDRAAHELTYRFTKLGEDAIRENPDHWIWIHKRWQTRPEARPELPVWDPAVEEAQDG